MKAILLATAFALVMSIPILLMRLYDPARSQTPTASSQPHQSIWDSMPNEEPIMPNPEDQRLHVRPLTTR
jgi:hypothetical protein